MKTYLIRSLTLLLLIHFCRINVIAQSYRQNYTPTIPEAAGMQLYGTIPVGEYTGTPDISIPIYTLKSGLLELPITLSYHAGGVKVAQEATWVGLGWNLLSGGCVNLNAVGKIDEASGTFADWSDWEKLKYTWKVAGNDTTGLRFGTEAYANLWSYLTNIPGNMSTTDNIIKEGLYGRGERDIFEVSLPDGRSFKYFLHPRTNAPTIVGERKNFIISHNSGQVYVRDESGTLYIFDSYIYKSPAVLTYMLTEMRDRAGHSITFTYTTANRQSVPTMSEYYSAGTPADDKVRERTYTDGVSSVAYLSKIESETEEIVFTLGSREDVYPGTTGKLTAISINSKLDNQAICGYNLTYDYFNACSVGGNYLSSDEYTFGSALPVSVLSKRLKLLSVTKVNGSLQGEKYSFTYNETQNLPYKTSFAVDYWGYYNGQENSSTLTGYKHTMIPLASGLPDSCALRNASSTLITANMLKSITYPTGGTAELEFEPHSFIGDERFISVENQKLCQAPVLAVNTVNNNAEILEPTAIFELTYRQEVTIDVTVKFLDYTLSQIIGSGTIIRKIGTGGGEIVKSFKVNTQNCSGSPYTVRETFMLDPGRYVMASTLSSNVTGQGYSSRNISAATLVYRGAIPSVDKSTMPRIGGGVRIKNIKKKDTSGTIIESVSYQYELENGNTSGNLTFDMNYKENYYAYKGILNDTGEYPTGTFIYREAVRFYSHSFDLPASSPSANPVGYTRVVKQRDYSNAGKEAKTFAHINCEYIGSNYSAFDPNYNGRMLTRKIYDSDGDLILFDNNEYEITNIHKELVNVRVQDNFVGPTNVYIYPAVCNQTGLVAVYSYNLFAYNGRFEILLYPYQVYDIHLNRQTTTEYGSSGSFIKEREYTYNSRSQVDTCRTLDSRGNYTVDIYRYAADMSPYLSDFRSYNVLDAIQSYEHISAGQTQTLINTYGGALSKFTLQQSTEYSTLSTGYRGTSFQYDTKWNVAEVTTPDNLSTVYLWGYNYSRVIAIIKGVSYSQVQNTFGSTALNSLCSAAAPNATSLYSLRTMFPGSEVTTYLYTPSRGLREIRSPAGFKHTYQHDALGRLANVSDHDGNVISTYTYLLSPTGTSQNYIRTRRMTTEGSGSYLDTYDYYDNFGRPFESVQVGITPNGSNLVNLQEYDAAGRKSNSWLWSVFSPDYVTPATFKAGSAESHSGDTRPYLYQEYENSPLDRAKNLYGAGAAWAAKPVTAEYLTNKSSVTPELYCLNYSVSSTGIVNNGNYAAGTLSVTKNKDEDGKVSYTFTDREGRTILSRIMNGTEMSDTYFVYDALGNLRYTLQPMYQSNSDLSKYSFRYKYDVRNRLCEKILPGAEKILYVYDLADNMIFSQDGNQRLSGKWTFYLYDKLHRLTVQGECTNTNTSSVLTTTVVCTRSNSNTGLGNSGYTSSFALTSPVINIVRYYDNYDFRSLTGFTDATYFPTSSVDASGHLTGSVTTVLGTSNKLYGAVYYDNRGRVTRHVQSNLKGGYDITTSTYTFTDNPLNVTHRHTNSTSSNNRTEVYDYTYDHAGRVTKVEHTLNGTKITLAGNTYDGFGRLATKSLHGSTANTLAYGYNIRDWISSISSSKFTQNLYYNSGTGTACYNGNISSMTWVSGNETTTRGFKFVYNDLNRLTSATYGEGTAISSNSGRFNEIFTYDKNGNISTLQRYGQTGASSFGLLDNLTYTLNGNQVTQVEDASSATAYGSNTSFINGSSTANEYTYDANGNLTKDLNKGITNITYNVLSLPSMVTFGDGSTISYTYSADGNKLRTVHSIGGATTQTDYCANIIYENNTLKQLQTEDGYVDLSNGNSYYYYLKDHQGNNRVVINSSGTVQETNHYYPFGGIFSSSASIQPYKYNSKEYDTRKDLNLYDYGARHYDPAICRWTTQDPMSEKYYRISPYTYCAGDPVRLVDSDGMKTDDYILNKQGDMSFLRKTEDKFDSIYNIDQSESIEIDKGIISEKATKIVKDNKFLLDIYQMRGEDNSRRFFEFLANNTSVEWSIISVGLPSDERNIITTSHNELSEIGVGYIGAHNYTINWYSHSHLYHSYPSKADNEFLKRIRMVFPKVKQSIYYKENYYPYGE